MIQSIYESVYIALRALQGASIGYVIICILVAVVSFWVVALCKGQDRRNQAEVRAIRANLKDWKL